jgi:protein-S-isoprenylcysteine O-methyltransferase Ste14
MRLSWIFLILTPPVALIGFLKYRSDYRRYGRTTVLSLTAILAAWLMPHCVVGFAIPLTLVPKTVLQEVGMGLMALGLVLTLLGMHRFGSSKMILGKDTSRLVTSGAYLISRNPQYTCYALFLLGYAMTGRSVMAYVGVALFWIVLHLTVVAEEEHLERVFGDEYRRFKKATPRYLLF